MLTAADEDTAVAVDVAPGQASEAPMLDGMLIATLRRAPGVDELVADRGFDGDPQRAACLARGVAGNIPSKVNRLDPWPFDPAGYRERNRVERLFAKLKQFRRVATRYEKRRRMFLGVLHLALGFIRLRATTNVNTA